MDSFTIGKLAAATETKAETIRYYERIGLLAPPERTGGNYRAYFPSHLARLRFIRRSRALGFSLDQVRALLRLSDDRACSCGEVDRIANTHLKEVEDKIADLKKLQSELQDIIGQCRRGTIADCRIIEALGTASLRGQSRR
ncbi:MAG: helix-turn-helix domain-containing protein [Proteobacteria bacterium]|nr:helix-turn-helix domain-containing protein [Pseudomonadota bacterium]